MPETPHRHREADALEPNQHLFYAVTGFRSHTPNELHGQADQIGAVERAGGEARWPLVLLGGELINVSWSPRCARSQAGPGRS